MANHFGFLDSQEEELNRIGLEIYDVSPGRYLEIDLNIDRKEPQRVYPYGRFDTITVLNPQEIIDHEIWIYINRPYLENRYPLNQISRMETKGNEIYLQHEKINAKLKLLVGGDARAFKVDPINKDNSVTDLGLLNNKAKNIQDNTEILKENSEINTTNIGQINVKQNEVIQNLEDISGKDFATQTTLAQVKSELELVKAELQAIKANQLSGDQKVQLSGTIVWVNIITANTTIPVDTSEVFEVNLPVGRKVGVYLRKGVADPPGGLTVKATAKAMNPGLFVDESISDSQTIVENYRAGYNGANYPVTKELNFYAPRLRISVSAVGDDVVVNQLSLWVVI